MERDRIRYRDGYKYQLAEGYAVDIAVRPPAPVENEFIRLDPDGRLTIYRGYAWDGPSGPTIDTRTFMRGSLVHDALYQLMREGLLSPSWRAAADDELRRICVEDGMCAARAWWVHRAVRRAAGFAADPVSNKVVHTAP